MVREQGKFIGIILNSSNGFMVAQKSGLGKLWC